MKDKNILVIGENIDDFFCYCQATRFDPAGPWPVLNPINTIKNPGGAGNVVANLKSLAGPYNLNVYFLHQQNPIIKTRYVCNQTNHCFVRIDENDIVKESLYSREQLFNFCNKYDIILSQLDCIAISSYNKGFLTKGFISDINGLAKLHNIPVFVDCKFELDKWSKDIFCIKINEKEYLNSDSKIPYPENYCENLIVTMGENGARWVNKKLTFPLQEKIDIKNLSGAGDTFFASLIINFLETKDLSTAIKWANKVCSYKVTQKGIIAVNRDIIS